jgi:hypothetical protein
MLETVEVQELNGLGRYHGQYQTPQEAARRVDQGDWTPMKDGAPPMPVGEPVTARRAASPSPIAGGSQRSVAALTKPRPAVHQPTALRKTNLSFN